MFVWASIAFRTSLYLTCCSVTANERKNVCMGLYCFQNISISYLLQCNSQLEEEYLYGLVLLLELLILAGKIFSLSLLLQLKIMPYSLKASNSILTCTCF